MQLLKAKSWKLDELREARFLRHAAVTKIG